MKQFLPPPCGFPTPQNPPQLGPFSDSINWIRFCHTKNFVLTNLKQSYLWSCPCFPSCPSPIHSPTIDRSWVAWWATSSGALVGQERLPRPAIRQITPTMAPTPITLTCILVSFLNPFSFRLSFFQTKTITFLLDQETMTLQPNTRFLWFFCHTTYF